MSLDGTGILGKSAPMRILLLPLLLFLLSGFSTMTDVQELIKAGRMDEAYALSKKQSAVLDPEGDEALAWFYDHGNVVAEDKAEAARLFRRAAEAGRKHSQWRLGVMLDIGEGVRPDPAEAVRWFERSAAQNYSKAYVSLGVMHATGRGVEQDFEESRRMYLAGARLGDAHGFFGVGVLFFLGQGMERDPEESFAWMLVSAALEDEQALERLDKYDLDTAAKHRAAARANEIAREFGLANLNIEFEEEAKPAVTA